MDSLSNVPIPKDGYKNSNVQDEVLNNFFPDLSSNPQRNEREQYAEPQTGGGYVEPEIIYEKMKWKNVGIIVVAFAILANPWIDGILSKIPYCGSNGITILALKVILFSLIIIFVTRYMN